MAVFSKLATEKSLWTIFGNLIFQNEKSGNALIEVQCISKYGKVFKAIMIHRIFQEVRLKVMTQIVKKMT